MESKMNEFIKITEGEKVALIDPVYFNNLRSLPPVPNILIC